MISRYDFPFPGESNSDYVTSIAKWYKFTINNYTIMSIHSYWSTDGSKTWYWHILNGKFSGRFMTVKK